MKQSFIGSTVMMVIGAILISQQLAHYSRGVDDENIVGGITMLLGALAYRSAKQRRFGAVPNTKARRVLEITLLGLVWLPNLYYALVGTYFSIHPYSSVLVPIGSIAAYIWVRKREIATSGLSLQ